LYLGLFLPSPRFFFICLLSIKYLLILFLLYLNNLFFLGVVGPSIVGGFLLFFSVAVGSTPITPLIAGILPKKPTNYFVYTWNAQITNKKNFQWRLP
jgi:hypothetical protein